MKHTMSLVNNNINNNNNECYFDTGFQVRNLLDRLFISINSGQNRTIQ